LRKLIIKSGVFILVFFITVTIVSRFMNRGNLDMTTVMGGATLPVVTFFQGEQQVNELHGHTVKMDVSSMASTIVQLEEEREVSFQIQKYGAQIENIVLEVRSCDGERLIEQIPVLDHTDTEDTVRVDAGLKDLLEKDTEYALVVVLTDENGREARYYTRCIWGKETYAAQKVAFVKEFHEATFDREAAKDLKKYMESNSSGDNTTLHKVNIHSSLSQLTWGELQVNPVTDPVIDILELGRDTGSFLLKRILSSGGEENTTYYQVEEYYRIRYTADRVYLLDFERTMTQLADVTEDIYANDKIVLGIVGTDVDLAESTDGNYLAFENVGQLCLYNVKTNQLSRLYAFYDGDNWDARTLYKGHDIKILDVDDTGNVKFAVYGYFNRGRHEGETGIGVYAFDNSLNTIEELVYLPYEKSWEVLCCEVEKLLYLNENNKLYVYLNQGIHQVDIEEKTDTELVLLKEDAGMHVSADHQIALWNVGGDLQILDLETEKKTRIPAGADERMQAVGFMDQHIICGVIRESDMVKDAAGAWIRPMYRVIICDSRGIVQKEYKEDNIYTLSVDVAGNQITLNRVKLGENGSYEEIVPEHIVSNEEQKNGKNKLVTAVIDVQETITQIQVKSSIDARTLQVLTPKEVIFEGDREVILERSSEEDNRYYVYNGTGIQEIYFDPARAIALAYETSGRVVDNTGKTVWYKGNRVTRNQIMAITEPEKVSASESLSVCLDTILKFEGITAQTKEMLDAGQSAPEILKEQMVNAEVADLTGCTMDAMLYFVNKDIPVLAILADGEAVLITGFNEFNTVIFEPSTGKLYKKGMNDSAKWFEENGNYFITYFEE